MTDPTPNTTTAALKITCPSCKGSGRFGFLNFTCMWCGGALELSQTRALHYAAHVEAIASGGYLDGTHDLEDARRMHAEAAEVKRLCNG